jgi:hypothetical protein
MLVSSPSGYSYSGTYFTPVNVYSYSTLIYYPDRPYAPFHPEVAAVPEEQGPVSAKGKILVVIPVIKRGEPKMLARLFFTLMYLET